MSQATTPVPKIFLAGKKKTGKSLSTAYLKQSVPGAVSLAFATPLKIACQALFLLSDEQLHDEEAKEVVDPRWNASPRQLFQRVGDLLRYGLPLVLPDLRLDQGLIFTQNMYWRLRELEERPTNRPSLIVIEDGRLKDEHIFFKTLGRGLSARLHRNTGAADGHPSEKINFACDAEYDNNSSVEALHTFLDNLMSHLQAAQPAFPLHPALPAGHSSVLQAPCPPVIRGAALPYRGTYHVSSSDGHPCPGSNSLD